MKLRQILFIAFSSLLSIYVGFWLQDLMKDLLNERETEDLRGGGRVNFWLELIKKHKKNFPYVVSILGTVTATTLVLFEQQLISYYATASLGGIYKKYGKSLGKNKYVIAVIQAQVTNKFLEAHGFLKAYELTPSLSKAEKLDGYKLIIGDLLNCDSKLKLVHSVIGLVSLLAFFFTGNIFIFMNMIGALVSLVKEGKISKTVAMAIVKILQMKGIEIPEELEEVVR